MMIESIQLSRSVALPYHHPCTHINGGHVGSFETVASRSGSPPVQSEPHFNS